MLTDVPLLLFYSYKLIPIIQRGIGALNYKVSPLARKIIRDGVFFNILVGINRVDKM